MSKKRKLKPLQGRLITPRKRGNINGRWAAVALQENGVTDLNSQLIRVCRTCRVNPLDFLCSNADVFAVSNAKARKLSVLGFSLQNVISTADHINLSSIISSPKTYRNVHKKNFIFKKKQKKTDLSSGSCGHRARRPGGSSSIFLKFFVRLL